MNLPNNSQPFIIRKYNLGILEVFGLGHLIKASHPAMILLRMLSMNSSCVIFSMLPFSKLDSDTEPVLRDIVQRTRLKVVALMSDQIPYDHDFLSVMPSSEAAALLLQRELTLKKVESMFLSASPFKASVSDLYKLLEEQDITLEKIQKCVLTEPLLVSRIFSTVNSAEKTRRNRIEELPHALAYLGLEGIRQIIAKLVFTNVDGLFGGKRKTKTLHSTLCAFIAERLGKKIINDPVVLGKVRIGALLHDLGSIAFEYCFPDEFALVEKKRAFCSYNDYMQLETSLFGIDHCELGTILCRKMRMPSYVEECISLHHQPEKWGFNSIIDSVSLANLFITKEVERMPASGYPSPILRKFSSLPELADDKIRAEVLGFLYSTWREF